MTITTNHLYAASREKQSLKDSRVCSSHLNIGLCLPCSGFVLSDTYLHYKGQFLQILFEETGRTILLFCQGFFIIFSYYIRKNLFVHELGFGENFSLSRYNKSTLKDGSEPE